MISSLFARRAWLPSGWAQNVRVDVDASGTITAIAIDAPPDDAQRIDGIVVPGLCDLHSHAFQRAMAGLAEGSGATQATDTFWTWRELMYACVADLSPEAMESIAAQLYLELLKGGYTSVCEFHYVHHAPDGSRYANRVEMSERIIAAAHRVGIGLTLLPVLYMASNFGGVPAHERQRRFLVSPDELLRMIEALRRAHGDRVAIGLAPHSLRAVPPDALSDALASFASIGGGPIHMHVAEQTKEVEDCIAWSGERPVQWLLGRHTVDARWCVVHATHLTSQESVTLARSGAVAGLCPSTEGNLGDGVFDLATYAANHGAYGIGSDSNVCSRAAEELRWLEYAQRMSLRRRNVASHNLGSAGEALYRAALAGGAGAAGRAICGIAVGQSADLVVLDAAHPMLADRPLDAVIDAYVFGAHGDVVRDVMVAGEWVVRDRRHALESGALADYLRAMHTLTPAI